MANPIEQAAAKTMGGAKYAKATLKGLKGVFKHLMVEHGEVTALIERVSLSSDPEVRRTHYPKIRSELLSHERAEKSEVYAVLRLREETREIAAEHDGQASLLERAIETLDGLDPATNAWGTAFERVAHLVGEHVEQEESEFFPAAQEALGEAEADDLLGRYESAKHVLMADLDTESNAVSS